MKTLIILLATVSVCIAKFDPINYTYKIDALINQELANQRQVPNPPARDEEFVKRLYLSAAGRLPTYQEITEYVTDTSIYRRRNLVEKVLNSEAYVSNFFNYWADVLRVKRNISGNANRYGAGEAYVIWIKDALRNNMPYDEFVYNLVTARGSFGNNGAVGYYLRDPGMNLDNTASTIQVFLGTRIGCAQCHDHPFDEWTQYEYYELAAFQWGVTTRINGGKRNEILKKLREDKTFEDDKATRDSLNRIVRDIFEPLSYGAESNNNRDIQLPHDYAYDDAKPKEKVSARTILGPEVQPAQKEVKIEQFGRWLASKDNKRFNTTIVNRLWKEVMGVGLIEPVDDMMPNSISSNPKLLEYLESVMILVDYDMRKFLAVLYNTKAFQRQAVQTDVQYEKFYYPGPLVTRMSAEQIWDNVVNLIVPNADDRKKMHNHERLVQARKYAKSMENKTTEELVALVKQAVELDKDFDNQAKALNKQINETTDKVKLTELKKQLGNINRKRRDAKEVLLQGGTDFRKIRTKNDYDAPWKGYGKHLVRASEVDSPAPNGHFLREFGAADRDSIDSFHKDATVPQILNLLNSNMYREIANNNSVLMKQLNNHKDDKLKQLKVIYLSMLCRQPTQREIDLFKDEALEDIIWVILNTKEFIFTS